MTKALRNGVTSIAVLDDGNYEATIPAVEEHHVAKQWE